MADVSPAMGRVLSRHLRGQAAQVAADWSDRHRVYPAYFNSAVQELGDWSAYARRFVAPLIAVLALGLRSGQDHYFHIYTNERLRFAPGDDDGESLRALLQADEAALIAVLGLNDAAPEAGALRKVMARTHALLTEEGDAIRIAFVGDCVMTEIQSFLRPGLAAAGRRLMGKHFYFSARIGAALDAQEVLRAMERDRFNLIALSFLTFEGLPLYTALLREPRRLSAEERQARCDALLSLIDAYLRDLRDETDTPYYWTAVRACRSSAGVFICRSSPPCRAPMPIYLRGWMPGCAR